MSDPAVPERTPTDVPASSPPSGMARWLEHLGAGITVGYLVLIAIGMFHNALGYRHFGINILEFAEASDFLLAPFRDRGVLLATVLPMALAWVYLRAAERYTDRVAERRRAEGRPTRWWETSDATNERMKPWRPHARVMLGLFWLVASATSYQTWTATRIMRGEGTRVELELSDGRTIAGTATRPLSLIGATSRYLFVFRTDLWRAEVIPTENVLRLVPLGTQPARTVKRRERYLPRLDSAGAAVK